MGSGFDVGSWCFVHAADLHLDTPFEGIGRGDDRVADHLRDSSLAAFDALVDETIARDAAFLVVAGDVYDGPERGLRAQLRFESGLRRLAERGIATFVVHGNHDPVGVGWQLVTEWPDGVTVFGHEEVRSVPVERDERLLAIVSGISYEQRAETRNLARRFGRTDADALHVGVLHANVGSDTGHAPYAPCSLDDLRAGGMDYWALGHVHRRQVLLEGDGSDPWVVYPGNLQGRSVRASERGPKGATVVHVDGAHVERVEHVTLDRARFEVATATLDDGATVGELATDLAGRVEEVAAAAGERVVVVRLELEGRGQAHLELARPGARDELLAAVRDRVEALDDVVVTGVVDRSGPPPATLDPAIAELLARGEVRRVVDEAAATARERGWTDALPPVDTLVDAVRATARSHMIDPS